MASSNGFMTLGSIATTSAFTNDLTTTGQGPIIAPLWDDLAVNATSGAISYQLSGVAPNRIMTIEWLNMNWYYAAAGPVISFQVKLYETTNKIDFIYRREATAVSNLAGGASIGINGGTLATDFYSLNGTGAAPAAVYGTQTSTLATKPATGQKYSWTPNNMVYSSSTCAQPNTSTVSLCDIDQDIISIDIVNTGGCGSPLSVTQFIINANGTTSVLGDISLIHLFYTGNSSTFSAANEFVVGGVAPAAGSITLNGNQSLSTGDNYFWIAYDINPAATVGNVVDAQCTQLTVAGVNHVPTVTNPAGSRSIVACSAYPGSGTANMKLWLKANAGTTLIGTSVTQWNDQSGAGITGNFIVQPGIPAQTSPTLVNSSVNFNPTVSFDGISNSLASNNLFAGGSLYDASNNTIFTMVNLKGGIVFHKWETNPVGTYRVGFEINGSSIRFDFVDDGVGKNANSTTNVMNNYVIARGSTNTTLNTLSLNANLDATENISGLTFVPGVTTSRLAIGNNTIATNNLPALVNISEIIEYNTALSTSETRRVESYLGIKYGITLGNNQGAGNSITYMASNGTNIWNNNTGYHNYVIGLGLDNTSTLNQPKSTSTQSLNGSIDIVTIANSNLTTPLSLTTDKSFLMSGSNAGTLATPILEFNTHNGPATLITYQLSRVWKTQKTGTFSGNAIFEFNMTQINGPTGYGTNINADIRLLVDDDANFYNASPGEHTYSPNAGFTATGGSVNFTVPYSNIQTGYGYYTLGSVNPANGTLPVEMVNLQANCNQQNLLVQWTTLTESNNNHFNIMESGDGAIFQKIGEIKGHGSCVTPSHYSFSTSIETESAYLRIDQMDNNGYLKTGPVIAVNCNNQDEIPVLLPNPSNGNFAISAFLLSNCTVSMQMYNALGQEVNAYSEQAPSGNYRKEFNMGLTTGAYWIRLQLGEKYYTLKFIIQ